MSDPTTTEADRFHTLLQIGMVMGQMREISDAAINDLLMNHNADFDYMHYLEAVKEAKRIAFDPAKKQPGMKL